jgi:dihydroxy-acid dehydratase
MNFNTLSGSAKLYKKLEIGATGQPTPSGEVPNIAILCAVDPFANQRLVENIAVGIKAKGGLATVIDVPAFGTFNKINPMTAKYAPSFAKLAASTAEATIKCGLYDGVVIVTDCDITALGLLQGAAYANCPALIMPIGTCMGKSKEVENYKIQGMLAGGKINAKQTESQIETAKTFRGIPHELTSTSTFFILMEAMGFCVPNASLTRIESATHYLCAVATGEAIFESAKNVITPKKFLTRAALGNTIALCLCIGGDISAIAGVTNLVTTYERITHGLIAEYAAKTSLLVAPENQNTMHLSQVGGIAKFIKQLSATPKFLDETALVYTGEKLKSHLAEIENPNLEPISRGGRIVHVKGSACEDGGYSQPTGKTSVTLSGRAWVYNSLEDADKALVAGNIPDTSIIVVHNCPNTFVTALAYTIEGMEKQSKIAVITDGLCDKTSALVVTRCTPDSLANQAFANIQNGDQLDINLGTGRLNTNISAKDIKNRGKRNSVKKPTWYFG